jgi:hypothetical protein
MRQLTGLECFFIENSGSIKAEQAAQFMQEQFRNSQLTVYAEPLSEQQTVLATLDISKEIIEYDAYAQRLEFVFIGTDVSEKIPLTYTINGVDLRYIGRCSVLPKVCGVVLYFSNYHRIKNSVARLNVVVSIN